MPTSTRSHATLAREILPLLLELSRVHRVIHGTIDAFPRSGRLNPANNTREYAVPGLPYLIIYLPDADRIDIIAIFHTSRDPGTKRQP